MVVISLRGANSALKFGAGVPLPNAVAVQESPRTACPWAFVLFAKLVHQFFGAIGVPPAGEPAGGVMVTRASFFICTTTASRNRMA